MRAFNRARAQGHITPFNLAVWNDVYPVIMASAPQFVSNAYFERVLQADRGAFEARMSAEYNATQRIMNTFNTSVAPPYAALWVAAYSSSASVRMHDFSTSARHVAAMVRSNATRDVEISAPAILAATKALGYIVFCVVGDGDSTYMSGAYDVATAFRGLFDVPGYDGFAVTISDATPPAAPVVVYTAGAPAAVPYVTPVVASFSFLNRTLVVTVAPTAALRSGGYNTTLYVGIPLIFVLAAAALWVVMERRRVAAAREAAIAADVSTSTHKHVMNFVRAQLVCVGMSV
jgi:hypothetical protein